MAISTAGSDGPACCPFRNAALALARRIVLGGVEIIYLIGSDIVAVLSITTDHPARSEQSLNRVARLFSLVCIDRRDPIQHHHVSSPRPILLLRHRYRILWIISQEDVFFMQHVLGSHLSLTMTETLDLVPIVVHPTFCMCGGFGDCIQQEV